MKQKKNRKLLLGWINSFCSQKIFRVRKTLIMLRIRLALTLLMRDLFETSLVTNNYPIAFFFWVVILTSNFEKGVFLTQNHTNRPARAL